MARQRLAALRPTTAAESLPTARQIWSGLEVSQSGTPSPDGRFLSFAAETGDLGVRDLVTGTSRLLTNTGGWAASGDYVSRSVISPDGRQVAYDWFVEKDFKNELRVIPFAAGDSVRPKVVSRFDRSEYMRPFGWSPDGKRVFVLRFVANANSIGTVSIQDGSFQSIKSLEWRNPNRLSVSGDGRFVAYDAPVADNVSARDIFVLATDGSREMTAVEGRANDFAPLWAPDNSQLIFLSDRAGSDSLWTVAMENGRPKGSPEPVKGGVRPSTLLGITQTGTLYYGVRASDRRNIHAVELNERMHAITSPVPATERFVAGNMSPSWSGDGASLAYYSLRNPTVLVIQSSNTGEERTVPVPAGVAPAQPRWFPDNRSVLILAQNAQGPGSTFYRLEVDTGKTEPLLGVGRGIGSYDLAPDGKTIFYSFQSSGQPGATGYYTGRLMRFDIGSNREVELKKNEWFINVAVSPDGTELAYLKSLRDDALRNAGEYPSVVEVIPAAGGSVARGIPKSDLAHWRALRQSRLDARWALFDLRAGRWRVLESLCGRWQTREDGHFKTQGARRRNQISCDSS
jgi:Tol biopolymer transport system component